MTNLSQTQLQKMLAFLDTIRKEYKDDDEALITINEIENELNKRKYGLVWERHEEYVDVKMRDNIPVFAECKDKEITAVPSERYNFILEGDNLHSLRLLEKTHSGRIDVIYIDPPYNTKNKDFVYDDVYVDTTDGFRHSKWLSFMAERLVIAKNLLTSNGVMFISINDNEQARLKMLCDEIFGEKNFVANIPWRKRTAKSDVPFGISQDYESILCYANSKFKAAVKGKKRKYYETDDFPDRPWRFHDLTTQNTIEERPNSNFTIINPKTGEKYPVNPMRSWAITKETFEHYYKENRIIFPNDYDFLNISNPVLRYWKEEDVKKAGSNYCLVPVSTYLPCDIVGMTQDGTKEITAIFGERKFNFPKPTGLIKYLIEISTVMAPNSIILDFFAGSGTTGHAVMKLNAEDGGHRQFILCTNNENNICEEITYERIKRVINGYGDTAGIQSNVKYFRTDFVSKVSENLQEELLAHISEMVELENGIKLDGREYLIVLSNDEADELEQHWKAYPDIKTLYVSNDIIFTTLQRSLFSNVEIHTIPDYYFKFEQY